MIKIRRADPSDHVALTAIRHSAILELTVPAMSPSQAARWANHAAVDRVTRAILHHKVWVAVQGVPIGWVEVDEDRVAALYVAPHCTRRGIGTGLLLRAEAAIREGGYASARLEASSNAANFYLHRGYCPSDARTTDGAWPLNKRLSEHRPNPPLQPTGSPAADGQH